MTPEQLAELKENVDLRKRLAKKIAHDCFRDTKKLEDMDAADKITDDEMKAIMRGATHKCYDLVLDLCSPHGVRLQTWRIARFGRQWESRTVSKASCSLEAFSP
jgi:hypothetical protein